MTYEDPNKPHKPTKRRIYDPEKHCGGPIDRSLPSLTAKVQKYKDEIARIYEKAKGRELKRNETGMIKVKEQRLRYAEGRILDIEDNGPDDRPCMQSKGFGTTHPGVKFCRRHCECKGDNRFHVSGTTEPRLLYPKAQDKQLRGIMHRMEASGTDLLDMRPEVLLLKAYIEMFVQSNISLLEPENVRSLTFLQEQIRRTVESIQEHRLATMITKEAFEYLMYRMGQVVAELLEDQPELLEKISKKWERITMNTNERINRQAMGRIVARGV